MAKLAVCIIILTSSLKPMGQNGNQFVELISQKTSSIDITLLSGTPLFFCKL
jgi:hypothetical protein